MVDGINTVKPVVWEYMASANEKDAKDHVAKAKKAKEEKDLKDALEVSCSMSPSLTVGHHPLLHEYFGVVFMLFLSTLFSVRLLRF